MSAEEELAAGWAGDRRAGRGGAVVSVDTSKLAVAEAALDAGAEIVNDVTALRGDPEIGGLCAERGAGLVLMHMQGTPRDDAGEPGLRRRGRRRQGLPRRADGGRDLGSGSTRSGSGSIPGIGFGKTLEHNLELLRRLGELRSLGRPLVVGTSRKSFIGMVDGSGAGERLGGTIASSVLAAAEGADVLRVHDVAEVGQAMKVAAAILG